MSQTTFIPILSNEFGGAIAVNIFAILSTLGLVSVALRIAWLFIRRHLLPTAPEAHEPAFFKTQLGQYAVCLLVAMMFSTVSGIIGLSWVVQRGITEGWVCRLQATLMQIATWSAGYFTVAIAIHTFNSLVLRRRQFVMICRSWMCAGWILAFLMGLIPFVIRRSEGYVYGAAGLSCGIRSVFPMPQFLFHLLPILIASLLSAIIYSLIFLSLRGTLEIRGGVKLTLDPGERWNNRDETYHRFIVRLAKSMLWYPVAYIMLLVPYSIVRLLEISGFAVPFEVIVFAFVCWFSLGIVDVLLLYNTFRVLTPAFDARSASAGTKCMYSFQSTERLQGFRYSSPHVPSMSWEKKIIQYGTGSPDFPSPRLVEQGSAVPLHMAQSFTTHIEDRSGLSSPSISHSVTPAFDYGRITTPSPSASIYSHDSAILVANVPPPQSRFTAAPSELPQSIGINDNFISGTDRTMNRSRSTQTFSRQDSPQSKISPWATDSAEISNGTTHPHPIMLPWTNEGEERLSVSTPLFLHRSPRSVTLIPKYPERL